MTNTKFIYFANANQEYDHNTRIRLEVIAKKKKKAVAKARFYQTLKDPNQVRRAQTNT